MFHKIKSTHLIKLTLAASLLVVGIVAGCSKSSDDSTTTSLFPSSLGYVQPAGVK